MALALSDAPDAGALVGVEYLIEYGPEPFGVVLRFERGELNLVANPEDDQLLVVDVAPVKQRVDGSRQQPWSQAVGRYCIWSWSMSNNTGHVDGAQLYFSASDEAETLIQLLVSASVIDVYELLLIPTGQESSPADSSGVEESGG